MTAKTISSALWMSATGPYAPFGEGVSRANEAIYRVKEGLLPPEGGETVRES